MKRKGILSLLALCLLAACQAATTPVNSPVTLPTREAPPARGQGCKVSQQPEALLPTPERAKSTSIPVPTPLPTPTVNLPAWLSTRAGFGLSTPTSADYWAANLYTGWYVSWSVQLRQAGQLPQHWQMIRLQENCFFPSEEFIRWTAAHYPGNIWIIGNEPDVIWQDNLAAREFARLYGVLHKLIKSADPAAKLAPGGISQSTPLRLAYLDQVLASYKEIYGTSMPVDVWTVHGFVLREQRGSWGTEIPPGMTENQGELREVSDHGRIDLFKQQIISFRAWLEKNGYRNTPLALTEFGILMPVEYGFPLDFVTRYMNETFSWLQHAADEKTGLPSDQNRLVQHWAWFSLADGLYPAGNLAEIRTGKLTALGKNFSEIVLKNRP